MIDRLLVRYGDLLLKGKNRRRFVKIAQKRIAERINNDSIVLEPRHDRLYIVLNGEDEHEVIEALKTVSGLHSFSRVMKTTKAIEDIKQTALVLAKHTVGPHETFKIKTKRADKSYPMGSGEISQDVAGYVLSQAETLTADIFNPDITLTIEVRRDGTYLFSGKETLMGGFPVGTMGKGLVMMSGGIDSPVAAFYAMRKGIEIELVHFESTPYTSIESVQKVYDLARVLALYAEGMMLKLHLVPFTDLHAKLLKEVPEPYIITIMRRMMVRITNQFAEQDHTPVLINGESIGQVASQTLDSLHVTQAVTNTPILRPLLAFDKNTIMAKAREIGTYDISIRPFEDCCTVYVPSQPSTSPRNYYADRYERRFDYQSLVDTCVQDIKTLTVTPTSQYDFAAHGFTVKELFEERSD